MKELNDEQSRIRTDLGAKACATTFRKKQAMKDLELKVKIDTADIHTYQVPRERWEVQIAEAFGIPDEAINKAIYTCYKNNKKTRPYTKIFISFDFLGVIAGCCVDFKHMVEIVMGCMGITDYCFGRVDMAMDSSIPGAYHLAYKASHALLKCLAYNEDLKNTYASEDINGKKRSLTAKTKNYEIEIYNKKEENGENIDLRAELRVKGNFGWDALIDLFGDDWSNRLKKCILNFKDVALAENNMLEELYFGSLQKGEHLEWYIDWKNFIFANDVRIRTRKQLRELVYKLTSSEKKYHFENNSDKQSCYKRVDKFLERNPQFITFKGSEIKAFCDQLICGINKFFEIDNKKYDIMSYFSEYEIYLIKSLNLLPGLVFEPFEKRKYSSHPENVSEKFEREKNEYIAMRDCLINIITEHATYMDYDDICADATMEALNSIKDRFDEKYRHLNLPTWVTV